MKKSLAILRFSELTEPNKPINIIKGGEWRTPTTDKFHDSTWTILCTFLEDIKSDNTVLAEIKCFDEAEPFVHVPGKKIEMFGYNRFKLICEVIKEL